MSTDDDNSLCRFAVFVTSGRDFTRPVFVMAKTCKDARIAVLDKLDYLDNQPDVRLQLFVLGESEVAPIMPEQKELAWVYFVEGVLHGTQEDLDDEPVMNRLREEFEEIWARHGVMTEPEIS